MYISSDTNIWLDFEAIGHVEHPPYYTTTVWLTDTEKGFFLDGKHRI